MEHSPRDLCGWPQGPKVNIHKDASLGMTLKSSIFVPDSSGTVPQRGPQPSHLELFFLAGWGHIEGVAFLPGELKNARVICQPWGR